MLKDYIIITSLIVIHECGHFLCAQRLGFQTDKIYLYPIGGIAKFYMPINIEKKKEFLVLIMGPIFQNIAYILLLLLFQEKELITNYHISILIFNLLPIYPLDGGKLLQLFLSCIVPYKASLTVSIIISYLGTVVLLLIQTKISINMIIIYITLIGLIRKEELKKNIQYQKFLLERFLHKKNYSKEKTIFQEDGFYRYKNNKIYYRGELQNEDEYLRKKYNYFKKNC